MSPKVIVLEEHFSHPDLLNDVPRPLGEQLLDLGDGRLRAMDEAGIDLQVISHFPNGPQNLPPDRAPAMARAVNELVARTVAGHPDRFAGFASLPLTAPDEACRELERAVRELGLKGAIMHGRAAGVPLDDKRFWGVFEQAQALDVPLYLHPDVSPAPVVDAWFKDYPALIGPGWSYTLETANQAMRLMLCGVLDACPRLKFIVGHMGESLPFSIVRSDAQINRRAQLKRPLVDYFTGHFWITTAANWSQPALVCSLLQMGADKIMFSVDWPFASNTEGRAFMEAAPISAVDRAKILGGNAAALLKL